MKYFVALSYSHREEFAPIIAKLKTILTENGDDFVVFVEQQLQTDDTRKLIALALAELENCDGLIAEMSYPGEGVGIEMGEAHGHQKPIIGIRKKGTEKSLLDGLTSVSIEYENPDDLNRQLPSVLQEIHNGRKEESKVELTPFAQFLLDAARRESASFLTREGIAIGESEPDYRDLLQHYVMRESILGFIFLQREKVESGISNIVHEGEVMLRDAALAQGYVFRRISDIESLHHEWDSRIKADTGHIINKIWNEMDPTDRELFSSPARELSQRPIQERK